MPHDLLADLRASTRPQHDALEALGPSRRLTDGTLDADGYESVIAWQRDAHAVAEGGLQGYPWPGAYAYRSRGDALAREGVAPARRRVRPLRAPESLAAAVGRAYVFEGSALGGNVILGHLRANPRLAAYAPFPFYAFQREVGLGQWRAFVAFATGRAWSSDEVAVAATAAREAFAAFAPAGRAGEPPAP